MALQYMDTTCPKLEKKLKKGYKLGIFRNGDYSLLSRLTLRNNLEVSVASNSLSELLAKTEFQLTDKLGPKPNKYPTLSRSSLETFIAQGGTIGIEAKYDVLRGYLFDSNQKIIASPKSLGSFSDLIQLMELDALNYLGI